MTTSASGRETGAQIAWVVTATTAAVTAVSYTLPDQYAATGVAFGFLIAVYLRVLRRDTTDNQLVDRCGLGLGGVLERGEIDWGRLTRDCLKAVAWAGAVSVVIFPVFWIGFKLWWQPSQSFRWVAPPSYLDEALGQLLVIALPEEAFYRGYMQSSLDELWENKPEARMRGIRILGTHVGWSLPATSAVFAVGHFLTHISPERLAVFFPSLVFGWLRKRTGGIGAAIVFHAISNAFSAMLGRGYGLY